MAHPNEYGQHAQRCRIGGDRAKLHDVACHIIHNACCEAGLKSLREVLVPMLATEKSSLSHGLTWTLGGHPGLPHVRLDFTVVDAETLHCSSAMREPQPKQNE